MAKKEIETVLDNIQYLAMDINAAEITSHIQNGNLSQWLSAWRGAMEEQINNIKEALK